MPIGQIPWNKGKGAGYRFLLAHVDYDGDGCLKWPFCRDKHGRGMIGVNGGHHWAHRLMCKLAHGEPPTPKHTAAHNCGKGHEGCIHPKHLEWKTQKENLADCVGHGTAARSFYGNQGKLKPHEVQQIRDLRDENTQEDLAAMFGVSEGAISDIWCGRTHSRPRNLPPPWTAEDDEKLREAIRRGYSHRQVAEFVGRPHKAVATRTHRLGLKSGWVRPVSADTDFSFSNENAYDIRPMEERLPD